MLIITNPPSHCPLEHPTLNIVQFTTNRAYSQAIHAIGSITTKMGQASKTWADGIKLVIRE
jgi:hypothetical protein